ncbi:PRC-barrel domain-containing protein [Roseomonas harenae]|uniref:PRC-barrel domain-containing protein n=1 Tax=Muricoccus harenae TaxID=2692566 RepID=UPI0013317C94|nr:PRC-barrel domain-containing protein [Roseomonas harenae]
MRMVPIAVLLVALAGLSSPVSAQAPGAAPSATSIPAGHIRAEQLMDRDVYTTDNVEVGEVDDLVIDPAQGQVTMVIIELEGRLGLTHRHVAVPLQRLRIVPGERRVTIDMASAEIRSLPPLSR